jgi:hypothetical protein
MGRLLRERIKVAGQPLWYRYLYGTGIPPLDYYKAG